MPVASYIKKSVLFADKIKIVFGKDAPTVHFLYLRKHSKREEFQELWKSLTFGLITKVQLFAAIALSVYLAQGYMLSPLLFRKFLIIPYGVTILYASVVSILAFHFNWESVFLFVAKQRPPMFIKKHAIDIRAPAIRYTSASRALQ